MKELHVHNRNERVLVDMDPFSPTFETGITRVPEFKLAYLTGPFFLGFVLEAFGMGIVLILSINYFLSLASRPKSQHESSRRLGVSLAAISLLANFAQTIIDFVRGWDMFAVNFMNLPGFLTTTPLYFISPFLGLIPSTLTQLFLLRRIALFLSSLDLLWPKLAHPAIKYTFVVVMGCSVLLVFVSGTMSSVLIAKSGNMHTLDVAGSSLFSVVEQIWLGGSTAVDLLLSLVLCIELWWARQKLGMKGGVMREIVTRLILVTCHGGLAVSGLQLSSLLLYNYWRHNSFCYLPIIFLPKVYNITLLLSLSVPHSTEVAPSPSHVFSLPTIMDHQPPAPAHASRQCHHCHGHNPASPPIGVSHEASASALSPAVEDGRDMREKVGLRWSSRLNAELRRRGLTPTKTNVRLSWDARRRSASLSHQHVQRLSGLSTTGEDRRPSDPNSISPLLRHEVSFSPGFRPEMPGSPCAVSSPLISNTVFQRPDPFRFDTMASPSVPTPSPTAPRSGAYSPPMNVEEEEPNLASRSRSTDPADVSQHTSPISTWESRQYTPWLGRGERSKGHDEPAGEESSQTRTMSSTFHVSTSQTGTGLNSVDLDGLTFDVEEERTLDEKGNDRSDQ
ncbi:hypothetical protein IAU59_001165 [Kwoniella sp. CBS 9459]